MLDIGDPAFKLFGKTIPLLNSDEASGDSNKADLSSEQMSEEKEADRDSDKEQAKENSAHESVLREEHDADSPSASKKDTSEDQKSLTSIDDNSESEAQKDEEKEQDGQEAKNSSEKTLKKPDKILPCPRCKSMDTKFCYYNNYNVNQPRHFCKSCQRYWTAGGTMRNVPVGAGRRKNKSSPSKYCHMSISDALQAARIDLPHTQPETGLKINGTVLNFGVDSPLCDSMASSTMNLVDNKAANGSSTVTMSISTKGHQIPPNVNGFNSHQVPCFPGFQLAYGWTPTVPLAPPPPGFFPSMPFYPPPPPPYWNGAAIPWNMPFVSVIPKSTGSNPNSPTLGKHSRDEEKLKTSSKSDKSSQVLVPKTLRIDDPEEAAKSSIWTTLGIKKVEPAENGGFFKGLKSKSENKSHEIESFPVLNANPAALARSISYQETV